MEGDVRHCQSEPDTRRKKKPALVNVGKASPQASPVDVRRSVKTGEFPSRSQERCLISTMDPYNIDKMDNETILLLFAI